MKKFLIIILVLGSLKAHSQEEWNLNTSGQITYTSGNLGIGTTSPNYRLEVERGDALNNTEYLLGAFNHNANGGGVYLGYVGDGVDAKEARVRAGGNVNLTLGTTAYRQAISISNSDGNVGVGTTMPSFNFTVGANLNNTYQSTPYLSSIGIMSHGAGTAPGILYLHRDDVTISSGNKLGAVLFSGADGGEQVGAEIRGVSAGNWSTGQSATDLSFFTTTSGSSTPTEKMVIRDNGNVGIGTTNPDEKLTVKGTVHAEEVKVDLSVPGPDYVFEPTYNLRTLEETEAYIQSNKHLPEIPSAKEMEASGVQLGEMNMLLLKKIEELTLYVIELKKGQAKLEEENKKLKKLLNHE
ncbi:hypothetical protein [Ekhidna sp.]|uniref:hypothetical protein n=1 Tax=Ekhidna sp. TaxID=2608089 RepID=UPI003B50A2FD